MRTDGHASRTRYFWFRPAWNFDTRGENVLPSGSPPDGTEWSNFALWVALRKRISNKKSASVYKFGHLDVNRASSIGRCNTI